MTLLFNLEPWFYLSLRPYTQGGVKTLKLKGSVHQQTGALDEFQKEDLR